MATPGSRARSVMVMLSVLVGVGVAASAYLVLSPPADEVASPRHAGYESHGFSVTSPSVAPAPTTTTTAAPRTTTERPKPEPTTTTRTTQRPATSKPPTSTVPTSEETRLDGQAGTVVGLVNAERAAAGCEPVEADARLTAAAQRHSDDMAARGYLDHTTPDGVTFDARIANAGYPKPAAENIAMGRREAEDVMDAWMASEGHRRNILNCDITAIGVGMNRDGWYWTQTFGY